MKKVKLKRIKKDVSQKKFHKIPDYEGFMQGKNGDFFHLVGWLNSLDSDMNLTIKRIDSEQMENKFFAQKFMQWRKNNANNITNQKKKMSD